MGITTSLVKGLGSTLTSLLPIAALGLGAYLIIKNAGYIGQSVGTFAGTGLRNLGSGLTGGFGTVFDIFGGTPNANTGGSISQGDPNVQIVGEDPNVGIVTPDPSEEGFHPIATPFKGFVSSGQISREFAEQYSFQPPAQPMASGVGHQLDVSSTFAYIGSEQYRNLSQASQANTNALAREIAASAQKYPEWFA